MSNQCSNLFDYRSFSVFTPFRTPLKPYSTVFHNNLILNSKRSRRTSSLPSPPLAAQSSSDVVLIATTEHRDGSLLFRFGDASEAVKKEEVVEETESEAKCESNIVKVLNEGQERQVNTKTIERDDRSGGGRLIEVADGIINAGIDSDVTEIDTSVISDLRDYHEESSERLSDITEEEVLPLQSVNKMKTSLEGVESMLDTRECTAQLDGDESSIPTTSFLDNCPSRDKRADCQGTVLKDSDDETEDPSVSAKLETMQVSHIEVMDVNKLHPVDELHKVKTEDTSESDMKDLMPPATMHVSPVEFTDATSEDVEEGLQDINIDEGTLTDEMPPSDSLVAEPTSDEVSQLQSANVKLEATMEVSTTEAMDVKHRAMQDELQQVSTINKGENDIAYVMPASSMVEPEPVLEEELSQLQSAAVELKPTMQILDVEVQDITDQNPDDGISQVIDAGAGESYINNLVSSSHPLEAQQVQDDGVNHNMLEQCAETNALGSLILDITDQNPDDGISQAIDADASESYINNLAPSSHPLEAQQVQDEGVNDNMSVECAETDALGSSILDITDRNPDDGISQAIDADASESYINNLVSSSHPLEAQQVQDKGVNHNMSEECGAETDALGSSILLKQGARGSLLEAEKIEGEVSSIEFAGVSEDSAILLADESKVEREEIYLTDYFLSSGAALLEHSFKALTGGDDAYFVAGSKWLGVANGVNRWSFEGTDPGVYAQELMRTCEKIVLASSSIPMSNPVELLCRGIKETNTSGSSNILIANFDDQVLHVANIGDTGFLIIRHGAIYKKSSPLLHEFHFALQVEGHDDPLQLVEEHKIELDEGDVIVCATDGLFDNLYGRDIAMIVSKSLEAGMKPEEIAEVLATRAQEVGRSALVRSPFSDAAQAAGYTGYAGGKPDNVAVVVSLVEKRSNRLAE